MQLDRIVVDVRPSAEAALPIVVLLHGFMGKVDDLAPFARALGVPGQYVVPHGIYDMEARGLRGRAWWPIDVDERDAAITRGQPRDLSALMPEGLDEARQEISALLIELGAESPGAPIVLGGFSQGGMLSFDLAFRTDHSLAALAMFSGARIAEPIWCSLYRTRAGLPTFMSHGRSDPDLAFSAAERFKDDLVGAGLHVDWCPFDGKHEIPLVALRAFKKFLKELWASTEGVKQKA